MQTYAHKQYSATYLGVNPNMKEEHANLTLEDFENPASSLTLMFVTLDEETKNAYVVMG